MCTVRRMTPTRQPEATPRREAQLQGGGQAHQTQGTLCQPRGDGGQRTSISTLCRRSNVSEAQASTTWLRGVKRRLKHDEE
ncbi:hypothetical protein KIN20_014506 [Parelaphostrongylus tenuis]|uniref:Uncharacterized protein n=1 Tax=Parelaphostrongylus tenuis TaxID=148309 RepID=A0AAD5MZB8_PARTN|nr:hypothetical protein KIN20_014506 [Parelaphostrongylus tenuis]